MIFWNREAIDTLHKLQAVCGADRIGQTNSRRNGSYGIVHVYEKAEYKGKPEKANREVFTLHGLKETLRAAEAGELFGE